MTHQRDTAILIAVGAVVALLVVAAGLGAFGMTATTSSGPVVSQPQYPPEDGSSALVLDLHVREGMSFFGIKVQADKHEARVWFITPPECISRDEAGNEELLTDGVCADLPVHGEVLGGGTTPSGAALAIVRLDIARHCYETLSIGDAWPSTAPACDTR